MNPEHLALSAEMRESAEILVRYAAACSDDPAMASELHTASSILLGVSTRIIMSPSQGRSATYTHRVVLTLPALLSFAYPS